MLRSIRVMRTNTIGKNEYLGLHYADTSPFRITSVDGLDPITATINTTDSVYKHGSYYNSTKFNNRNILLYIDLVPNNHYPTPEHCRQKIYDLFITGGDIQLEFKTDTIEKPVYIDGYVERCETSIFSDRPSVVVSILCPNPYFYENDLVVVNTTTNYESVSAYTGTAPSPVTIKKTLTKLAPNFVVSKNAGDNIKLASVPAGTTVEISFDPMNRYIKMTKDGSTLNAYQYVESGSLDLWVSKAQGHIRVSADPTETPGLEVSFRKAYLGL